VSILLICPPLVLDILNFIAGAERAENQMEQELQKNDGAVWVAGGYRNRLYRGAVFFAAESSAKLDSPWPSYPSS